MVWFEVPLEGLGVALGEKVAKMGAVIKHVSGGFNRDCCSVVSFRSKNPFLNLHVLCVCHGNHAW